MEYKTPPGFLSRGNDHGRGSIRIQRINVDFQLKCKGKHPAVLRQLTRRDLSPPGARAIGVKFKLRASTIVTSTAACFFHLLMLLWGPQAKPLCGKDPQRDFASDECHERSVSLF